VITLDGQSISSFGLIVQKGASDPIIPETRERVLQIPGRDGLIDFGAELAERMIDIPLAFPYAISAREMQQKARAFAKFLTDSKGRPRNITLTFDHDIDKHYTVRITGTLSIERLLAMGFFTLSMVAVDPFKYLNYSADDPITLDSEIMLDTLEDITLDSEDAYTFTVNAPGTVQVRNIGTVDVSPVVVITGSFTTFSLAYDGKTLSYSEAIASQTLTIDFAKMTAKIGATNKLGKVSGEFFELPVGLAEITIGGTGLNCTVFFDFQPKYL
jgi:predicted phage tail component-like protein